MNQRMMQDFCGSLSDLLSDSARLAETKAERNDYKARALSYEAANMEQGKLLNEVIAERDELLAALEKLVEVYDAMGAPRGPSRIMADAAIAKSKPEIQVKEQT